MAAPESCGHRGDHRASWLLGLPAALRGKEGERRVTSKACYFCTCILAFKPLILSNFQLERMACTYAFISAPSSNPPKIGLEEPKGNNQDLQENRRGGDSRRAQEGGWRLQEVGSDSVARAEHRRQSRPGATTGEQAGSSGCRRPPTPQPMSSHLPGPLPHPKRPGASPPPTLEGEWEVLWRI